MQISPRGWFSLLFAVVTIFAVGTARAQTTADILGTIADQSGAILPGGEVTVTNEVTGTTQTKSVSNSGEFHFTDLQVGPYAVKAVVPGFEAGAAHVVLAAGDHARVNLQLSVGSQQETITVQATTPALQTDTATVGTLVNSELTQDLPLNGRNVTNLVTLAAGVTSGLPNALGGGARPDDRRQDSSYSANGESDKMNNNLIDGLDNNERLIGTIGVRPSIDDIQEVRVLTNLYPAEVSRSSGAVVDIITKAGSNQFHGSLYEFFMNDISNARTYFATVGPKPELRQNQFGGSVGGPIKRNKAFFFFDYADFRLVQGLTALTTVPTPFEEQNPGNFTDLGAACTNVSSKVTKGSIGSNFFALFPAPNVSVATPGTNCTPPKNNYNFTGNQTQFAPTYDARVDYHLTASDSLYVRYTYNGNNAYIPGILPITTVAGIRVNPGGGTQAAAGGNTFPGAASDVDQSGAVVYTRVLSPNAVANLHAQLLRMDNESFPVNQGQDTATAFGFPCNSSSCINLAAPYTFISTGLPNITFSQGYAGLGDSNSLPLIEKDNSYLYTGDLSVMRNSHSFKFGASLIRRQFDSTQSSSPRGSFTSDGNLTGNDLGDMLLNYATIAQRIVGLVNPDYRSWEVGFYAQDDWHARKNLTLNLGIRYDIYTPFTSANFGFTNFNPQLGLLIGPGLPGAQQSGATAGVKTDYGSVSPRIGFDYTLRPGLVVRGGYGTTYFPANNFSAAFMKNAPYSYSFTCGNTIYTKSGACAGAYQASDGSGYLMSGGLPVPSSNIALATNPANYAGTTINSVDFDFKNSLLQQYTLNIEKDLGGNVVTIAYVGNHGSRLVEDANANQLPYSIASGGAYPFPSLPGVTITETRSVMLSNYSAAQVSLERRMKSGLAAQISYVWSHNTTNAQVIGEGQAAGNCVGQCHVDNGTGQAVVYNSYYQYDYGNSDLDTRSRFTFSATYNLPFGNTLTGPSAWAAKGWTMNAIYYAQTGNPITITNSSSAQSGIGVVSRPNVVPSTQPGFHKSVNQWYDVTRFQLQASGLLGNEARNQIFGPGSQALNLSIFKSFPVRVSSSLQFRLESFNLLNTPTFASPGASITSYGANNIALPNVSAGVISGTPAHSPARRFQLALKYIF